MMTTMVIIIVFICFINVVFHMNSLLMILLSLEALMLSIMFLLSSVVMINEMNLILLCITMLSIGACEASMGLSLLVLMSRLYGSDLMLLMSMCKC